MRRLRALVALGSLALFVSGCPSPQLPSPQLPGTPELNLAWEGRDANGLPYNPSWAFQQGGTGSQMPLADPEKQCGGFPTTNDESSRRGDPQCTNQDTGLDLPTGWHKPVCGAEFLSDGRWGKLRGHVNWRPVTVSGHLTWEGASKHYPFGDDDHRHSLAPAEANGTPSFRGLTRYNKVKGYDIYAYHIEYRSTETVTHFSQAWWTAHRDRVESGKVPADSNPQPGQILNGTYAIATGLFGLDAEHAGYSELHPIYALSMLVSCAETPDSNGYFNDEWAVFVRNWGNEGFCADWQAYHMLDLADGVYAFRIPLPGVDAQNVKLGERTQFLANLPRPGESTRAGKGPFLVPDSQGVEVRLQLPAPDGPITRENDPPRLHGLLHLQWKARGSAARTCPRRAPVPDTREREVRAETEVEGEDMLELLEEDRQERGLAAPDAEAAQVRVPLDTVEITDRSAIPAPAALDDIPDRMVHVPLTARTEVARPQDVDEPPPAEICEAAQQMDLTHLDEQARRRIEELRAYCRRTQR